MASTGKDFGQGPSILNGWKEIADYIGKSVRSAQRAEDLDGLPIRRLRTAAGQIVYADRAELDRWRTRPEPVAPLPPVVQSPGEIEISIPRATPGWLQMAGLVGLAALFLLVGVATGRQKNAPGEAVEFRLIGRQLEGIDSQGVTTWTYRFDTDVSPINGPGDTRIQTIDLDGDGQDELLVPTRSAVDGVRTTFSDALHCFTRAGVRKWTVRPDQTLTFGSSSFGAPWTLRAIAVTSLPERRVWMAFAHHTWWPGFVMEATAKGEVSVSFVMDGRIDSLAAWSGDDGPWVVAGGVSYRTAEASLAFLKQGDAPATAPTDGNPDYRCIECPTGLPRRMLSFPPSEMALETSPFPWVSRLTPNGNRLGAVISDYIDQNTAVLNQDLSLGTMYRSPRHWEIHRALERQGRIRHAADDCPERTRPNTVREWTPALGWREATVKISDPIALAQTATR